MQENNEIKQENNAINKYRNKVQACNFTLNPNIYVPNVLYNNLIVDGHWAIEMCWLDKSSVSITE